MKLDHLNRNLSTIASYLRDFTRINPPMFFLSKVNENNEYFLDEVYKTLFAMGVASNEKVDLALY